MQLGFVIDHGKCIGCHACTIACKSENDVPLGSFRTWVKYTETGSFPASSDAFPSVKRHFAVLRCNQCTDAPCVTICPTSALEKRADGIVDLTRDHCIGCKSCMQGCPYDAIYINDEEGTAEKCHFCAHRTERGLAPACAIVCPTEAIIPGDFHDAGSVVAKMKSGGELTARKEEAGTGPNVWYREVDPTGIQPGTTNAASGYLWANTPPGPQIDADEFALLEARAGAQPGEAAAPRTTYDIPKKPMWGAMVSSYLFTKSISAGAILAGIPLLASEPFNRPLALSVPIAGILFLLLTTVLLVGDLKKPERFLMILTRPNWSSWLVRGSIVLMVYGGLLAVWLAMAAFGDGTSSAATGVLGIATIVSAALAACYTAFLFGQAKGRVLWMQRGLWLHLIFQAVVAGAGFFLAIGPLFEHTADTHGALRLLLGVGIVGHLLHIVMHGRMAPVGREDEYARAARLISHGPYAARHRALGIGLGCVAALLLVALPFSWAWALAGIAALIGLYSEEDVLVRAGQALPIS